MDLEYSDTVQRHFFAPVGAGRPTWAWTVEGRGGEIRTGLEVRFWLALDGGTITRAAFTAFGCPHAIATASWLARTLPGRALQDAASVDLARTAKALDLPAEKWRIVLVAEDALRACRDTMSSELESASDGHI